MKTCSRCFVEKDLSEFRIQSRNLDGRTSACSDCCRLNDKSHYEKHKSKILQSKQIHTKIRRINVKAKIDEIKSNPCTDCKQLYHPCQMQFDHLGNKVYNVSEILISQSWETIEAEIAKCELVCANCHALRTYLRREATRVSVAVTQ